MRFKKTIILLLVTLVTLFWFFGSHLFSNLTAMDIPAIEGAYNLERGEEDYYSCHYLTYHLKVEYPAPEVIEYYKNYFKKLGWHESNDLGASGWSRTPVRSDLKKWWETGFAITWEHPQWGISAMMLLSYEHETKKPNEELHVFFRTYNTNIMRVVFWVMEWIAE